MGIPSSWIAAGNDVVVWLNPLGFSNATKNCDSLSEGSNVGDLVRAQRHLPGASGLGGEIILALHQERILSEP